MAAHVLAMHLARALGAPNSERDESHVLYPLCSRLVATLADQGYVLHGELPTIVPAVPSAATTGAAGTRPSRLPPERPE